VLARTSSSAVSGQIIISDVHWQVKQMKVDITATLERINKETMAAIMEKLQNISLQRAFDSQGSQIEFAFQE
jgi:hypothetical protein